jgi:NADP-dependent 3-hydroxy acid dehydrogenase YdfG
MNLKNKVILITGGTSGIGRATAVLLAQGGADVVIFGRHEQKLKDALTDIKTISGEDVLGLIADTSKPETLEKVFQKIDDQFGHLDVLINNAALGCRSIMDSNYQKWREVIDVNILGYMLCARMALDKMIPNESGHIINISSLSAEYKEKDADLYVATKSAISGFNDSLRKKVNPLGIKVTLIEPGSTGTDMVSENSIEQQQMQKEERLLKAEDIAEVIYFILRQPSRALIQKIEIRANKQYL